MIFFGSKTKSLTSKHVLGCGSCQRIPRSPTNHPIHSSRYYPSRSRSQGQIAGDNRNNYRIPGWSRIPQNCSPISSFFSQTFFSNSASPKYIPVLSLRDRLQKTLLMSVTVPELNNLHSLCNSCNAEWVELV